MSFSDSESTGDGDDGLRVEVIRDSSSTATVYWWNQSVEDKQVSITLTNVNTGTQSQFDSQHDVNLFYLPTRLTSGDEYAVTVRGTTSQEERHISFRADENHLTVELTARTSATVHWPDQLGQSSGVEITLKEVTNDDVTVNVFNCTLTDAQTFYSMPQTLTRGQRYKVTVHGVSTGKVLKTRFRAEFTRGEMETLLRMAETFADGVVRHHPYNNVVSPCDVFYRNKTPAYYDDCYDNHDGCMNVYLKDNNGDPASVINGQISGLFFMASIDLTTGRPRLWSPFGTKRLSLPALQMFPSDANLYFADFYCNYKAHYVTLVLTKPGSDLDHFCKHKRLIEMDNRNNKFLNHRTRDSGETYVEVTTKLMVEVYYTENVELPADHNALTTIFSSGTSTPGGLPKNASCRDCNLPTNPAEVT